MISSTGGEYWRFRHGQTTPSALYPRNLTAANSPFRNLPISYIDDAVLAKNGLGNYFTYVIHDDILYKLTVEDAHVSYIL